MSNLLGNLTAFNVGIERVLTSGANEAQGSRLPEGVSSPSGLVVQQHLEKAIQSPNLDRALLNMLRPSPSDPTLVMPSKFNPRMRELARKLRERKQRDGKGGGKQGDQDAREERLEQLAELLSEDESLRDLLAAYRGLLISG